MSKTARALSAKVRAAVVGAALLALPMAAHAQPFTVPDGSFRITSPPCAVPI